MLTISIKVIIMENFVNFGALGPWWHFFATKTLKHKDSTKQS